CASGMRLDRFTLARFLAAFDRLSCSKQANLLMTVLSYKHTSPVTSQTLPMIEQKPDGTVDLSFDDWTPQMMALSSRLHQLPSPPGRIKNHEVGVDRLSKMRSGAVAVKLLFRHADELEYCPTESEVVRLGLALVRTMSVVRGFETTGWLS